MDGEKPRKIAKANRIGDNKQERGVMLWMGSKSTALAAKS